MQDQREFERAKPFMLYGVVFSLPGVYRACRFVIAERRALRRTRDALQIIREDTARRLATDSKVVTNKA
ncbi:hypothetical protein [Arthrobacter sp. MDT1-65]